MTIYSRFRSGYIVHMGKSELEGITVGHYEIPLELFANATTNPDNAGFCYPDEDSCPPTGLLSAESCQSGRYQDFTDVSLI